MIVISFSYNKLKHYTEMSNGSVADNLQVILQRISNAAKKAEQTPYWRGQKPSLLAVSKMISPALIQCCYDAGQRKFGENYIQELADKANLLKSTCPNICWHFIGTIQSNKIAKLVEVDSLSCVETISSRKHCTMLEQAVAKTGRKLSVLVQVNTSNEEQKGGTSPEMAMDLADFIRVNCPSLKFSGFMTIGSLSNSTSDTYNKDFTKLFDTRKMQSSRIFMLFDLICYRFCQRISENEESFELSMGMSQDYETAIMQGSTCVRIGSALFGPRLVKEH
ncbi:unnamed protein product [Thelazia callipaeda]|uniref:Pyridoxal phosphate homeostasis protein n=1 Tax=Thelazia callipaeda TaxID=103827 RepID=A0A0N5CZ38_THECL|nr:unnamed protein product [Thelazia callipaeda]